MPHRRLSLVAWLCAVIFPLLCAAAINFPTLTGPVMDEAHLLSPQARDALEHMLRDYQAGSGNQVVVATIPSLQGQAIEDYGYQLGRFWQLGQKGKNNGAILLVAPTEHKIRIEVGYGLEPVLTDATSSAIVQSVILPQLRKGNMEQGIIDGAQAMISALGGQTSSSQTQAAEPQAQPATSNEGSLNWVWLLLILFLFFRLSTRHPLLAGFLFSNMRFGGSSIGGGSGGGYSGGGGSFGGGGASGSW